jgi:acyl-CoA thioester hydrolase
VSFCYFLRVRYSECDAQGVVFSARWAEYVDVAAGEYFRALFGSLDTQALGWDSKLVKQTVEWKTPARYDDVLDVRVRTAHVGTTSFTLTTEFRRHGDDVVLVAVETVYVMVDPVHMKKQSIRPDQRAIFERGVDVTVDHAGAARRP